MHLTNIFKLFKKSKSVLTLVESLFLSGNLFVLFCTSTLAIGVNLPAHLVIIKSTMCYSANQTYVEYTTTQINQMIGRAGRPQFDDSARAVIMTKEETKMMYENLLNDQTQIESNFHHELIEHLNVEIVLQTIENTRLAINWLKSTFFYIRIMKNPSHYGVNIKKMNNFESNIDEYLNDLSIKNLQQLIDCNLVEECDIFNEESRLKPTNNGVLMAKYCLAFETMKLIISTLKYEHLDHIESTEKFLYQPMVSLEQLIVLISMSKEFQDIKLRTHEKSILNKLNFDGKTPKSKENNLALIEDPNIIRFRINSKIKTSAMKTFV
jgi:ATP-dependent DNA helicase HFM1/MER3